MKKTCYLFPILFLLFSACNKDDNQPYSYWSSLVDEKHKEINLLTGTVPCSNIDEFEIVNQGKYYLVHPSIQNKFNELMQELRRLQTEAGKAASREGILSQGMPMQPTPPLRKECKDGKPTLVYAQQLTLEEIEQEIPVRYEEIKNFYNDVPCTDPNLWSSHFLRVDCCYEGIAVHKTIKSNEINEKIQIFNKLTEAKTHHKKLSCMNANCPRFAKPVQCINNKPVVELTF